MQTYRSVQNETQVVTLRFELIVLWKCPDTTKYIKSLSHTTGEHVCVSEEMKKFFHMSKKSHILKR